MSCFVTPRWNSSKPTQANSTSSYLSEFLSSLTLKSWNKKGFPYLVYLKYLGIRSLYLSVTQPHHIMPPTVFHMLQGSKLLILGKIPASSYRIVGINPAVLFLDLLVQRLDKNNIYSPNGGESMVMNPMVESVKHRQKNNESTGIGWTESIITPQIGVDFTVFFSDGLRPRAITRS